MKHISLSLLLISLLASVGSSYGAADYNPPPEYGLDDWPKEAPPSYHISQEDRIVKNIEEIARNKEEIIAHNRNIVALRDHIRKLESENREFREFEAARERRNMHEARRAARERRPPAIEVD